VPFAVFIPMWIEAARARRNERVQRARGGVEPAGDVYAAMQVAYPGLFLAMVVEGLLLGQPSPVVAIAGVVIFLAAKSLKWWAIWSLGSSWTFRVIVVPRATLVSSGPYRYLHHPNYVAVVGEIVGVALMSGARVTGPIALLLFGGLLLKRIAVENRALRGDRQPRS
jgi:methyltransferase